MNLTGLKTERLVLRGLEPSDAGPIALYLSDARVARSLENVPHPYPRGLAEDFVARVMSKTSADRHWAIEYGDGREAQLIGLVSLNAASRIGYWLGGPHWETGFATEAVGAVLSELFLEGTDHVTARVLQDNAASAHVLSKLGFAYTGDGEVFSVARNALVETWEYRLERSRWHQG